ncbi:hypothetical protein [Streptomyces sp. NPDC048527]|uniref:hypothetical protein n=1 Tax=Streptomyces sp. NPDC048527 TaxID=3365568 RepID=UPI00371B23E3
MDRLSVQTFPIGLEPDSLTLLKAKRIVASYANGADDCRGLLEALGLIEPVEGVRRVCPTCGAVHRRQGSSWRSRFCTPECERTKAQTIGSGGEQESVT